jgi:hypothetical protein
MAAVFAFGKRGANNRAPVSNYLISMEFDFDGVKVRPDFSLQQEPARATSKPRGFCRRQSHLAVGTAREPEKLGAQRAVARQRPGGSMTIYRSYS